MHKQVLRLAAFFAAALFLSGAARANVAYHFIETGATGFLGTLPLGSFAPRLVIADAAYQSGSLSFSQSCPFNAPGLFCTNAGDMSGFVSLSNASPGIGNRAIDIGFNGDGTLSGSVLEQGLEMDLDMTGSHFDWSGTLLADFIPACGFRNECGVSGYWIEQGRTAVPEPASLAVFASGVVGLFLFGCYKRTVEP